MNDYTRQFHITQYIQIKKKLYLQYRNEISLDGHFDVSPLDRGYFQVSICLATRNEIVLSFNSTLWAFFPPIAVTFAYTRYWM